MELIEERAPIIYSEGINMFGQLGSPDPTDTEFILYPKQFRSPPEEITAGNGFSVIRDERLNVYTFGLNDRGQLGRPGQLSDPNPQVVTSALLIKSGDAHTIGIDLDTGNTAFVLGFGDNSLKQLSQFLPTDRPIAPWIIFEEGDSNLITATAAGVWTGILTDAELIIRGGGQNEQMIPYINGKALQIGKGFAVVIGNQIELFNPANAARRRVINTPPGLNLAGSVIVRLVVGVHNFAFTAIANNAATSYIYNVRTDQWGMMPDANDLSFNQDTLILVDRQNKIYTVNFDPSRNSFIHGLVDNPFPGAVRSIVQGENHRLVLLD